MKNCSMTRRNGDMHGVGLHEWRDEKWMYNKIGNEMVMWRKEIMYKQKKWRNEEERVEERSEKKITQSMRIPRNEGLGGKGWTNDQPIRPSSKPWFSASWGRIPKRIHWWRRWPRYRYLSIQWYSSWYGGFSGTHFRLYIDRPCKLR